MTRRPSKRLQLLTLTSDTKPRAPNNVVDQLQAVKGYLPGEFVSNGGGLATIRRIECEGSPMVLKCGPLGEASFRLKQEYSILRQLIHESIVRAHEWHSSPTDAGFIMDYQEGATLKDFFRAMAFDPRAVQAQAIAEQILSAVAYLHANRVVHRDLHTKNVIVDSDGGGERPVTATLIDFGSATQEDHDSEAARRSMSTSSIFAGERTMPLIMPPQDCPCGQGSATKRDAFAAGLLVAGLARRRETHTKDVIEGTELQRAWWAPAPTVTKGLAALVLGLLDLDPKARLTAEGAMRLVPPPGSWFESMVVSL